MRVFKKLSLTLDPLEQRRLKIAILSTTQSFQWCDSRKGFVAWITKHESHACSIMSSVNINNFANQPRTVDATPNYRRYNDTGVSQSAVAWVSLCFIDQTMWNWTTLFAIEQHVWGKPCGIEQDHAELMRLVARLADHVNATVVITTSRTHVASNFVFWICFPSQ